MTRISIRSDCKGVVKFFNHGRATGLIRAEDGSEFYINRRIEGDADRFDRGMKVKFSVHACEGATPKIVDVRPL